MTRAIAAIGLIALVCMTAFGQSQPAFEIADVQKTPKITSLAMRTLQRAGRYEIKNATMLDLIRTAYGVVAEDVFAGPTWLEFDRYDVIAKIPPNTPQETIKLMLRTLLADRFKLTVHNDTKQLPAYVLTVGKGKPRLKEAEPNGRSGCQQQPATPQPAATPGQITLPVQSYACRNITMEAFAAALQGLSPGTFTKPVVDSTGLKGAWDFDVKWTSSFVISLIAGVEKITVFDAVDKQLGLKLEEQKLPSSVIVVDQVNQTPTPNPPDLAAKLPPLPVAEFEVADIKPVMPGSLLPGAIGQVGLLPGGRVNLPRFPLRLAISLAWNLNLNEEIAGAPKWIDSAPFDIIAKVPADLAPVNGTTGSIDELGPMLQSLLTDRFKMKTHFEDRQVTAYTLVSAKPKLKKADPSTRTGCKLGNSNTVSNVGVISLPGRLATCQNITMTQFASLLQMIGGNYVHYPVVDATGLDGAWDFSFTFSPIAATQLAGLRGATPSGPAGPGTDPGASDPVGGVSFFDALEKQLGLKLEPQKRSYPVFVIDHIEEKPTEN